MDNNNYLEDSKKFWGNYEKAREERDNKLARLPFSEKAAIVEKLQTDYEALQNTKKEKPEQFGFEMPPDASNVVSLDLPFTKEAFEGALKKVFPLSQALIDDEESSKT